MNLIDSATPGVAEAAAGSLSERTIDRLRPHFRGELLTPADPGYPAARRIWNGMIDKRPGLIARCSGVADIIAAIRLARDEGLLLSVRAGGHNVAGTALCDGGLVLDLSRLKGIHVDPLARRVRIQPGGTNGDLDHDTQAFGLATTSGIASTTGLAGLTLGGGLGISRCTTDPCRRDCATTGNPTTSMPWTTG